MSLMFFCLKITFVALMSLMFLLSKNLIRSPYVSYVSFYLKFSIFAITNF